MNDDLNLYGDRLVATTGTHGPDIASQRIDDLDRRALEAVLRYQGRPVCADLGCGLGFQGLRFALLGGPSYLYDLLPEPAALARFRADAQLPITYWSGDVLALSEGDVPARIDIAFSQRFVHFLRFDDAMGLMQRFAVVMPADAPFFISGSGIDSELGQGYPGQAQPVERRFANLQAKVAEKHNILHPVCLYNEQDLCTLMERAGFAAVDVWRSAFGNVKGVFRRAHA